MSKKNETYTVEEILLAGKIGEVSMIDTEHICSLLPEAKTVLKNQKELEKSKTKKYKFSKNGEITYEIGNIMLNKVLEKYGTTIEEINKTNDKTIEGVYWLDFIILTESEFNVWRSWCKTFLLERCLPKYSKEWIDTQFGYWSLLYSFDVY